MGCLAKHTAEVPLTFTIGAAQDVRAVHVIELCLKLTAQGSYHMGLSCAGRAPENDTTGRVDAQVPVDVGEGQWQQDQLSELGNLLGNSAHIFIGDFTQRVCDN